MDSIYNYSIDELDISPNFRKKQVFNWLYKKYVYDFEEMKNIPKDLIKELKSKYIINPLKLVKKEISIDKSIKYLFQMEDGRTIESVFLLMKEKEVLKDKIKPAKYTFCISTQVGCKVGCSFCLTAKGGFIRDLSVAEIIAQIIYLKKDNNLPENKSVNIVYMGMGEPLDNYDNVVKAIRLIANEDGLNISTRRQTISTSGISDKIVKLGKENLKVQLAISLHAVDDELRTELIPLNKAYNIKSIIDALKKFPVDSRKRIMFEYLVIKDKNDDINSAKKLVKLLNGIKAKVNLIYFNPYEGTNYKRPTEKDMKRFQKYLLDKGVFCSIRESKGIDISAACGQLREKNISD